MKNSYKSKIVKELQMAITPLTTDNVELETADRTALINKYEALERLLENPDFKLVVLEGYIKEKAVDSVSLLATNYTRRHNLRGAIMEELVAISAFEEYMRMIQSLGARAEEEAEEAEEEAQEERE